MVQSLETVSLTGDFGLEAWDFGDFDLTLRFDGDDFLVATISSV